MGMRKEYASRKGNLRDLSDIKRPEYTRLEYASNIFNHMRKEPDSLINPRIILPEGDIYFSDSMMDFDIKPSGEQRARFQEKFLPSVKCGTSAYFRKGIKSEGGPIEYSVHIVQDHYHDGSKKPIKIVLAMPKPVVRKLKPREQANGYKYHPLDASYEGIDFDKALKIGLDVKKDAEDTFGFEKINLGGVLKTEDIINVCVRPMETDEEGFSYVLDRSLGNGAELLINHSYKSYGEHFPSRSGWDISMKDDKGMRAKGHAWLNRKAAKEYAEAFNRPLDLFIEKIPEDAKIEYGCYEMTDFGIKLANVGEKAIGYLLVPLGAIAAPFATFGNSLSGKIRGYKSDRMLKANIREKVITERMKESGIPENYQFDESCLIGVTPKGMEKIDAEIERRFIAAKAAEASPPHDDR